MRKRIMALALCMAMLFSTACSSSDNSSVTDTTDSSVSESISDSTDSTGSTDSAVSTVGTTAASQGETSSAPESSQPETTATEATKPETSATEATKPKTTVIEATKPKTTVTQTAKPQTTASTTKSTDESRTDVPEPTDVSMTAADVAQNMGLGINLGNTMEAYNATNCEKITYKWIPKLGSNTPSDYETCWGAPVTTQKIIDGMKKAGFDTVRIPVFWGNMMENDGTYTINPAYLKRVREIVDYCRKADMYAVINIHHFDEFIIRRNSLADCEKIFNHLWTQIADYFKDYPYTVIFEGYNEYLGGNQFDEKGNLTELSRSDGYALTNALNQTFVDAVRATGGKNKDRVLIVSGYWTNIDLTTSNSFVVPTDTVKNRLMVSVHYVDNAMYWSNKIGGSEWLKYTESQCELLKKAFTDKGIPVFIGEVTSIYPKSNFASSAKSKTSTECLEIMFNKLLDYGFVPVLWDTNNNFYSRTKCEVKNATDKALIEKLAEKIRGSLGA